MVVFCTCWLVALVPHSLIGLTRPGQPTGSSLLTEQWSWEESIKASSPFTICDQHTAYLRELSEGLGAQGRKVVHRGGFLLSVVSQGTQARHHLSSAASATSQVWGQSWALNHMLMAQPLTQHCCSVGDLPSKFGPIFLKIYLPSPNILKKWFKISFYLWEF